MCREANLMEIVEYTENIFILLIKKTNFIIISLKFLSKAG